MQILQFGNLLTENLSLWIYNFLEIFYLEQIPLVIIMLVHITMAEYSTTIKLILYIIKSILYMRSVHRNKKPNSFKLLKGCYNRNYMIIKNL